jgi:hypothetical protein
VHTPPRIGIRPVRAQARRPFANFRKICHVRRNRTLWVASSAILVYPWNVDTSFSNVDGSRRGTQDETGPFPLEFEIVARRKRVVRREARNQDETAPFPLEFEILARKPQQSQDETSPFLLEFAVVLPNGQPGFVRTARPPRSRRAARSSPKVLPRLKWHGVDASTELREYAARIAAGEVLPPYRGPILANGELPRLRPERSAPMAPHAAPVDDSNGFVKLVLAFFVMSAFVVASAMLGDDATLRNVGHTLSRWITGGDESVQMQRPSQPPSSPVPESPVPQP